LRGATLPWVQPAYLYARSIGGNDVATMSYHGERVHAPYAAYANSVFSYSCELQHHGSPGSAHVGVIVVPVVQALGEQHGNLPGHQSGADDTDLRHLAGQREIRCSSRFPGPLLRQVERVQPGAELLGDDQIGQTLRLGGQAGGQVGTGSATHEEPKTLNVSDNLFFDTCAYDPWYLGAAIRQRGVKSMVFGSEAPGSGSAALNPQTGKASDDVVAIIDHFDFLKTEDKVEILHNNPLRVFPLLKKLRNI
jgi:hypothetical protein